MNKAVLEYCITIDTEKTEIDTKIKQNAGKKSQRFFDLTIKFKVIE